ncbi:hypothetical protein AOLI_G00247480 [Acnodon oligacanthus]
MSRWRPWGCIGGNMSGVGLASGLTDTGSKEWAVLWSRTHVAVVGRGIVIGYLSQEELLDKLGYSTTAVTATITATTGIQGIQPL